MNVKTFRSNLEIFQVLWGFAVNNLLHERERERERGRERDRARQRQRDRDRQRQRQRDRDREQNVCCRERRQWVVWWS